MKTNVCLISSLRRPFRSLLLVILFGLISFGFVTKTVEYILIQRETEILGSYYRSIGVLENLKDTQSGDVSAGVALIKTSPYFAYGDQRRLASGVMSQTYNTLYLEANFTIYSVFPKERWPNVHNTDTYFIGELMNKEEVKDDYRVENKKTIGYYLSFNIDTVLASYPDNARQGYPIGLLFMFQGNETAIPIIQEMEVGQRYFIRYWFDLGFEASFYWENAYKTSLQIIPLDDKQLWYIQVADGANIDFNTPEMASIKNDIDELNENKHTLGIIATTDMSAMPRTQEASRYYYLIEGRWLNHQDDLAGSHLIVVSDELATMRKFNIGDEITLTFRPLKDTYYGFIRDGVDKDVWKSYPTYQETFRIIGLFNPTGPHCFAYIPNSSLPPGFESAMEPRFRSENDYGFVLKHSRYEAQFIQEYKILLQNLGISLTFLENNGQAYWDSVDPIRRSLFADVLIYGVLMIVALILAVFLFVIQHRREYAISRTLGVPTTQANGQLVLTLLFIGGVGILTGGILAWNYAINQAKASLSALPTPAGVYPSAELSPIFLASLCTAIFLLLGLFSWLGAFLLSHKPVFELLQGQASRPKTVQKQIRKTETAKTVLSFYSTLPSTINGVSSTLKEPYLREINPITERKYNPSSLSQYVLRHVLRSWFKSFLTFAIGLIFILASGWILKTMEQSRKEVNKLFDTTVVEADFVIDYSSTSSSGRTISIPKIAIESVLNSGFIKKSLLGARATWTIIEKMDSRETFNEFISVNAYNSPEILISTLDNPDSLNFAQGWDVKHFAEQFTPEEIREDGIPAIFPVRLIEQLQLNLGDLVKITDDFQQTYTCNIVGQYSGGRVFPMNTIKIQITGLSGDAIFIPLSVMENLEGSKTEFTMAHFIIDPKKNRELPHFRAEMGKYISNDINANSGARLVVWDEELRIVVAQLEKNISLFQVLYPVLIAVSVLIGAGLCFLLIVQAAKEAAILRMLGTTKMAVRLTLISEPLLLSIIGVIIGLVLFRFLWMGSGLVPLGPLLMGVGLYLVGVSAGLVISAISVTNKKPMELLQVKE